MTFLLDTNSFSRLAKGEPGHLRNFLSFPDSNRLAVSVTVVGETAYGCYRIRALSRRWEVQARENQLLAAMYEVFPIDIAIADRYGEIYADLSGRGFQIPMNDAWIAATALVHGCVLISSDRHFDRVTGLTRIDWSL